MSTGSLIDSSFGGDHSKSKTESLLRRILNPICCPDGCVIKIYTVKLKTNLLIL